MIQKTIIISLIITAVYISMREGMIFCSLRVFLSKTLDKMKLYWFKKPLFDCVICMGFWYTLLIYPILYGFHIEMLIIALMVIGLNTIIDKIINFEI